MQIFFINNLRMFFFHNFKSFGKEYFCLELLQQHGNQGSKLPYDLKSYFKTLWDNPWISNSPWTISFKLGDCLESALSKSLLKSQNCDK